jgi:hypothetical protein
MGHIHVDDGSFGQTWECPTCGGRLFESDTITALCRKLQDEGSGPKRAKYRLVACELERYGTIDAPGSTVWRGPMEKVLVVTFPAEQLQILASIGPGRLEKFRQFVFKAIEDTGWTDEVLICSDDVQFAHFERVDES